MTVAACPASGTSRKLSNFHVRGRANLADSWFVVKISTVLRGTFPCEIGS